MALKMKPSARRFLSNTDGSAMVTVTVEDGSGVSAANSYQSVQDWKAYADQHGDVLTDSGPILAIVWVMTKPHVSG